MQKKNGQLVKTASGWTQMLGIWLIGLCLFGLTSCLELPAGSGIPHAEVHPLNDWEYHWGDAPAPPPADWHAVSPPLNPPERQGNHWLWLRAKLPTLHPYDSLYLRGIDEEFEVWLRGSKIYSFGQMPPTSRYYIGFPWHMIPLSGASGDYVYFRIYSDSRHIGIFGQPSLGAPAAHLQQLLLQDLDRLVVGFLLIFIALLVFLLFVREPIKGYGFLGLAAASLGTYLICRTEIKQLYALGPATWKWLEYAGLFCGVPALCWFLNGLFPGRARKLWSGLILLQIGVEVVCLALAAAGLISIQDTSQPFLLMTLASMGLGLGVVVTGFRRLGSSGVLVLAGILAMCAFTGYDILAALRWVPWVRPVAHWGLLMLLLSMVLALRDQVEKLYHDKRVAEEANRTKTEFLTSVSHEIRTPLNAILGFSELLAKDLARNRQASEYVGIIHQAGQTLLLLINDILDLSRIEARRMPVHPRAVALHALLSEIHQLFRLGMNAKSLDWEIHVAENVPERVTLDDVRLRQILLNLVGNAQKFTHQGGVTLNLSAEPHAPDAEAVNLRFEVSDTGIGIPPAELERVFQAFYQVERSDRRSYGGTGLGLSISRRLAELLNGTMAVESVVDQGTRFILKLKDVPVLIKTESDGWDLAQAPSWLEAAEQDEQEAVAASAELPPEVRQPLFQSLQELRQNKSISRIQKYADEIESTGARLGNAWLMQFGQRLKEALRVFDIGQINALLDQLSQGLKG